MKSKWIRNDWYVLTLTFSNLQFHHVFQYDRWYFFQILLWTSLDLLHPSWTERCVYTAYCNLNAISVKKQIKLNAISTYTRHTKRTKIFEKTAEKHLLVRTAPIVECNFTFYYEIIILRRRCCCCFFVFICFVFVYPRLTYDFDSSITIAFVVVEWCI